MKKLACILMCLAVIAPVFSLVSYAVPIYGGEFYVEALSFPENMPERVQHVGREAINFYSNVNGPYLFGSNLTVPQKAVYDAIIEQKAGLETEGEVSVTFPRTSEDLGLTLEAALCAAIDDYPEYFWLGGYGCSYYYDASNYYVTLRLSYDTSSYPTWDDVVAAYNSMFEVMDTVKIDGGTRYQKAKAIHDYICSITEYVSSVPMAHQPTGVFLNGQAVCEGYAEAFKLLCDREGVPCIIVVGTGNGGAHEWNYVQMDDGKWYGVDVTWDDQSAIYYDYFLVGSESYMYNFFGRTFGDGTSSDGDHINTGTHFVNPGYALTYPAITERRYSSVLATPNSNATFDNVHGIIYIEKRAALTTQIYSNVANEFKATFNGTTTGGTLNITIPVTRTYTVVRRGDVNKDNSVDRSDYTAVRDIATYKRAEYSNTAQFAAADMNSDGSIDAMDAIYLDLYYHDMI